MPISRHDPLNFFRIPRIFIVLMFGKWMKCFKTRCRMFFMAYKSEIQTMITSNIKYNILRFYNLWHVYSLVSRVPLPKKWCTNSEQYNFSLNIPNVNLLYTTSIHGLQNLTQAPVVLRFFTHCKTLSGNLTLSVWSRNSIFTIRVKLITRHCSVIRA